MSATEDHGALPPAPQDATRRLLADASLVVDRLGDGSAHFWINRPQTRNTLTLPLLEALAGEIDSLGDAGCRVAVIRGIGGKAFSSGFDIQALDNRETVPTAEVGEDGFYALDRRVSRALNAIEEAPFPVIAAIDGWCIGGGLELAMACDLRLATAAARFRMPPAKLGWVYSLPGLARFTAAIGVAAARWMFLTAEELPSERALAIGLVHEVVAPEALDGRIAALTTGMLDSAPIALAGLKQALATIAAVHPSAEDFGRHRAWRGRALDSADLAEGRRAFLERRKPQFKGR